MNANDLVVMLLPVTEPIVKGGTAWTVGDFTEGSHKISNEVRESVRSGLKDFDYGVTEEEVGFTMSYVTSDKGQKAFKNAIQNKTQLRVWIVEKALMADGENHNATFFYAVVEELEDGWDNEEGTREVTLKIKLNSAEGPFPKLPSEILNPSEAVRVAYEKPHEYTGPLESKTNAVPAG